MQETLADHLIQYTVMENFSSSSPFCFDCGTIRRTYGTIDELASGIAHHYASMGRGLDVNLVHVKYVIFNLASEYMDSHGDIFFPLLREEFKKLCEQVKTFKFEQHVILSGYNRFGKKDK